MINLKILHPLLKGIAEEPSGITSYGLAGKMGTQEQKLKYHLQTAEEDRFVKSLHFWHCKRCKKQFDNLTVEQYPILFQKKRKVTRKCSCGGEILKNPVLYVLTDHVFVSNGFGIIYDQNNKQFSFVGCPHYGRCPCTGEISDKCQLLKDMCSVPVVKKFLQAKRSKEVLVH